MDPYGAHLKRGDIAYEKDNYAGAATHFKMALRYDPWAPGAYENLAGCELCEIYTSLVAREANNQSKLKQHADTAISYILQAVQMAMDDDAVISLAEFCKDVKRCLTDYQVLTHAHEQTLTGIIKLRETRFKTAFKLALFSMWERAADIRTYKYLLAEHTNMAAQLLDVRIILGK